MLTRFTARIAASITAAALGITALGLTSQAFAAPTFDPAMNFGYVTVNLGDSVDDQHVYMPVGVLNTKGIKLVNVEGPAGLSVNLDSFSVEDNDQLKLNLTVKSEFFKGTGAGAYPVALTLEDASGAKCTIFVTVQVQ